MRSGFISKSVYMQVFVCSDYDLCNPG